MSNAVDLSQIPSSKSVGQVATLNDLTENQRNLAAQGADLLGTIIYWDLYTRYISRTDLESLAAQVHFPDKYLPPKITPISGFKKAIERAGTGLRSQKMRLVRVDKDNANTQHIVYALMSDQVNPTTEKVTSIQADTIRFDKKTHEISSDNCSEVAAQIAGLYPQCLQHGLDDIRTCLTNMIAEVGISLRAKGGFYFVPAQFHHLVESAGKLMKLVNPENVVYQLDQFETPGNVASLQANANTDLEGEISQIGKDINELLDSENPKEKSLLARLTEIEQIRARVQLFSGCLRMSAQDLENGLNRLQNRLNHELGIAPAPVAPASTPVNNVVELPTRPQETPVTPTAPANPVVLPKKTAVGF